MNNLGGEGKPSLSGGSNVYYYDFSEWAHIGATNIGGPCVQNLKSQASDIWCEKI